MKFKIGDKVRLISKKTLLYYFSHNKNKIGKVYRLAPARKREDGYVIIFDKKGFPVGGGYQLWVFESELESVVESGEQLEFEFMKDKL